MSKQDKKPPHRQAPRSGDRKNHAAKVAPSKMRNENPSQAPARKPPEGGVKAIGIPPDTGKR